MKDRDQISLKVDVGSENFIVGFGELGEEAARTSLRGPSPEVKQLFASVEARGVTVNDLRTALNNLEEAVSGKEILVFFSGHGCLSSSVEVVEVGDQVTRDTVREVFDDPARLYQLSPLGFENFVAEIYRGLGYQVEITQRTYDGGLDLKLKKTIDGMEHEYAVQCKFREKPKKSIGVSAVRELLGAMASTAVTAAILVTNYIFSKTALKLIKQHSKRLFGVDCTGLRGLMARYLSVTVPVGS